MKAKDNFQKRLTSARQTGGALFISYNKGLTFVALKRQGVGETGGVGGFFPI
jgi:hypothetical protein